MPTNEDALKKAVNTSEIVLLKCSDKQNQDSVRTTLYRLRKKMYAPEIAQTIGISKFTYLDQLFIKVYPRKVQELYTLNAQGIPTLLENLPEDDPELQRQIKLMREDGVEEEEIEDLIENWKKEN